MHAVYGAQLDKSLRLLAALSKYCSNENT